MNPLVSIVILNWNGKKHITKCLRSIKNASYRPIEVIVVDNHSTDGSVDYIRRMFPYVKIIENSVNKGFSVGNNIGIKESHGKYVFILNNDTVVTKHFLEPLVGICQKNSIIACIQPKLVYESDHNLLNAVGSFLTSTGFLYHYGYRKDQNKPQYNRQLRIFSAKGAAMLLRKSVLKTVGDFDEDFFIYFEETDLCHRMWLAGFEVMYEPTSVIYHAEAIDTHREFGEFRITYLSFRNRIASYIKTLEMVHLVPTIGILMGIYSALFIYNLMRLKISAGMAILLSVLWNIAVLPRTVRKRNMIQHGRIKTDDELFTIIKHDPPFIYYYYLFTTLKNFKHEKSIQ